MSSSRYLIGVAKHGSEGETACAAVTNPAKVTHPFPRPASRAPGGKAWHDPDMLAMLEAEKLARHQRLKSASCESCRAMKVRCEARGKQQSCERCLRSGTKCSLAEQDGDEERPLDARPVDEILKGEKTYRREVLGEVTSDDDDDDDDQDDDEVENDDDDADDGDSNDEESGGGEKRAQRNPRRGVGFHRGQIGQSYIGVGQRARHNGEISWTPVVYYAGKQRQLHPVDSASTGTVFTSAEEAAHVRDGAVIALGSTKMILNFEDKALCTKPKWAKAREWGAVQFFEMQRAQPCPVTAKAGAGSVGARAKGTTCWGCAQQFKSRAALIVHERLCTPPEESDEEEDAVDDGESTDDEADEIDAAYLRKTARSGPGSSVASGQKRPYGTTCEICRIAKMRCEARGLGQPCARCMRRGTTCTLVEKEQKRAKKAAAKCAKLPASKRGIVDHTVCQRTVGCSKQNRHVGRCERPGIVDAKAVHTKQRRGGGGGGACSSRGAASVAGGSTAREAAGSDAGLPGGTWSCERCTLENLFAKKKCGACFAMRPGPRTSRQKVLAEQEQLVPRATSDMVGEFISFAHDKPRKRKRSGNAGGGGAHTAAKRIPRPPGRSPRGKHWCHEAGAWVNAGGRKGKQAAQIKPEQGGTMATAVAEEATAENQISDGLKRPYETTCDHCRASKIRCVPRGHLKPCKRCLRRGTSCSMTDSSRIKAEAHDASEDLERSSSKGALQVLCTRTPGCSNVDRHVGRCRNQPTAGASAAGGSDGSFSTGNQSEEQSAEDDEQVPFHHDLFAHGDDGLLHMIEASDSPFGNG